MLSGRLRVVAAVALAIGGLALGLIVVGAFGGLVLTSDARLRLSETQQLIKAGSGAPSVLVVIHRIMTDQNAVEGSVIVIVSDKPTIDQIEKGALHFSAIVRDGSSVNPSAIQNEFPIVRSSALHTQKLIALQSARFLLPTAPSRLPYPYDDIFVRPVVDVRRAEGAANVKFNLHVQKAFPGRVLKAKLEPGGPLITLTRPLIQKAFFIVVTAIFWTLALIITYELFIFKIPLTSIQEVLAVAGFLVTAVGFRDVLGFSRLPTTGASEVIVIGLPLVSVALAMAFSLRRRWRAGNASVTS